MTEQDIIYIVAAVVKGEAQQVYVGNMDAEVGGPSISTRDYLRQAFFEKGVEIEFSGKGANERGVVIDLDTELMNNVGLNAEVLRFGQTVVRIGSPVL